jgi:hypothetical protein
LKINKYCKFLIYLWTDLLFGTAALLCNLFLLTPVIAGLAGHSSVGDNPLQGLSLALLGLMSGGISIIILVTAGGIWIGPTLLLLLFGLVSAPNEEEDQSGIGKQALLTAFAIVITIAGFLLFLMFASYKETKLFSFVILVITFIIVGIIFSFAFRDYKKSDGEEPAVEEIKRRVLNDSFMYCDKCGKKISKDAVFCKYCGNKL